MSPRRLPFALLAAFLASWSGSAAADRLDDIYARGHLIAGVKADYQPFGFLDPEGMLVGYDVDVARKFAEGLGVELQLLPVTSANRMQKLQRGEIDVIVATMGDTRSRRELVHMVEPQYYGDGGNVLMRTDSGIADWADLRGRPLCTIQGALWDRLARERLLADPVALNNPRDAAQALRNGHCVGWLYDEVQLQDQLRNGEWDGYDLWLPTRFLLPWAVAIAKEEEGGRLDRALGDMVAVWHRDGFFQGLEEKWSLPPSPYLKRARETWQRLDEAGEPLCRRDEAGQWPLQCREVTLITGSQIGGISGMSLALMEATGLDVSILYDPLDRNIFLEGLFLTVALSVITVLASIAMGIVFGWLMHRRVPLIAPLLWALVVGLRMTPPLLQLYVVFFGLGGVVLALGFTLDAFTVAAVVLSLYAAASNAAAFAGAADVAAGRGRLRFQLADLRRGMALCYAAVMGNSVNIVKATGMASTLALPELVHASTAIVTEKGNDGVMMNLLLLCYFVLVIATARVFRRLERGARSP